MSPSCIGLSSIYLNFKTQRIDSIDLCKSWEDKHLCTLGLIFSPNIILIKISYGSFYIIYCGTEVISATLNLYCGHNLVNWGHDLLNCGHNLVTCGHNLLTWGHDWLNCGHNLVTCGHNLLTWGHDLLNCGHNLVTCGHNLV